MAATYCHLAYLQQASEILEDKHRPLAARLGFIAKKISAKHVVHVNGADTPKLRRCKACQAPISIEDIRCKSRIIHVKCSLCGTRRRYSAVQKEAKKPAGKEQAVETEATQDHGT